MEIGIYPGTFDPVTLGHLDIIIRASRLVDKLIIGVLQNRSKKPVFTTKERVEFIERVIDATPQLGNNIEVIAFDGLLVDFAKDINAAIIVRGLRAITDFEYELQIAQTNHKLYPNVDTVFLTTSVEYSYLSSSTVREVAGFGGDVSQFIPECILNSVLDKFNSIRSD